MTDIAGQCLPIGHFIRFKLEYLLRTYPIIIRAGGRKPFNGDAVNGLVGIDQSMPAGEGLLVQRLFRGAVFHPACAVDIGHPYDGHGCLGWILQTGSGDNLKGTGR